VTFGILVSFKLHMPDFASADPLLTWGRLRYNHTQGIFFGWLGNYAGSIGSKVDYSQHIEGFVG